MTSVFIVTSINNLVLYFVSFQHQLFEKSRRLNFYHDPATGTLISVRTNDQHDGKNLKHFVVSVLLCWFVSRGFNLTYVLVATHRGFNLTCVLVATHRVFNLTYVLVAIHRGFNLTCVLMATQRGFNLTYVLVATV